MIRYLKWPTIGQCIEGDIRLVGGATQYEGRVEFCHNGQWGTVCDDRFNRPDGAVVWRQLEYGVTGKVSLVLCIMTRISDQSNRYSIIIS